ncbi:MULTISPECIES: putative signal transducing protein [unclassified Colwellia]|uniref:putative signal transducing protein n=1 Tax=unclassified Colwellia TaxID=196834 RepID=UPI0015F76597|nr:MULTISPECIES: DUF2007 domain-containing protein [unclassified Colwellia]MBA6233044.1 DUF2007 domain-containing protein [Colwellia sp. MB02u-7]MBA6236722.1 DUF2007 domain-containing protein [Colwellia sp. MB02u-11]MBA6255914.1 DUF2007 domain-containing protein [Colwellia sp. MB3u-28]MBA6262056.1 DUF2007 domain-containing protein [Colwellia sp. MB3u-41]MBA6299024.1 DUF2007 domain-containing protein [Colwellia sp. MB3u-22]
MKLLYSNENQFLVNNVKNIIEAENISSFIKNEFAQGAVGEISAFDSWPEVWVANDEDYERALALLASSQLDVKGHDWLCKNCKEKNAPSFEICWNCQHDHL